MSKFHSKALVTPENEFLPRKQEVFVLDMRLPAEFKADWVIFRKRCTKEGKEFEDVLCEMIRKYANETDLG